MSVFTISTLAFALVIFIIGVVLLKKNIKPILGFFLLIIALVLFIGMSMSSQEIEKTVNKIVEKTIH